MKEFFGMISRLVALTVLLAIIFVVIIKLQIPEQPGQAVPRGSDLTPKKEQIVQKSHFQRKNVNLLLNTDSHTFKYDSVPLYEMKESDNTIQIRVDGELAKRLIESLPAVGAPPVPAVLKRDKKGNLTRIVRGTNGEVPDIAASIKALEEAIREAPGMDEISVDLALIEDEGPEGFGRFRVQHGFDYLIASSSTLHSTSRGDDNRNINLALASGKVDGYILKPGEEFSFNKIVGARSKANGFREAGVISNGRVIPGLGGGICQVTTALYQSALRANLRVTERYNHSIYQGIEYAPRGLDAAVVWGYKDFRFVNTLDFPILVSCIAGSGTVDVAIYGERRPFDEIRVATRNKVKHPFKFEKRRNPKLKDGEKKIVRHGVTGYTIEAYRVVTIGSSTREERISRDRYLTFNQVEEVRN